MVHAMLRLFFGQVAQPMANYQIDVTEVTNFGRLLISVSEQVQLEVKRLLILSFVTLKLKFFSRWKLEHGCPL